MTDTTITGGQEAKPALSLRVPYPEHNYSYFISKLQMWRKVIRRSNRKALERQITILLYLYRHESMTAVQLRSMMNIPPITGFRYMSALTHAGLVKWKGSHVKGAYRITEEGKHFITDPGYTRLGTGEAQP